MNAKNLSTWLVAGIAGLALIGCGNGSGGDNTTTGGTGADGPKVSDTGGNGNVTATVDAQGSTFILPFLSKVFDEYKKTTGFQVNYTGGGSSAGIKGVSEGTIPFGASDAAMSDKEMGESKVGKIINVPLVLGTIAIAYNIPGIDSGLKLDGETLAQIFMCKITKWNDPKIAAMNPDLKLPDTAIAVQVRADGSGSTYVLSDFLSNVSPEWKSAMGTNKKLSWNERAQQWQKSDGVANNTKQTPGSITYVELNWVKKSGLNYASIKNAAGKFVAPEPAGATAAASAVKLPEDFRASIVNATGDESYPISSYTFGLIPEDLTANAHGADVIKALTYVVTDGQQFAEGLDYAKLPDDVAANVKKALESVKVK
jgi:phosphate transport system substrate-binding protein